MRVGGRTFRSIWLKPGDERVVLAIDPVRLPHEFTIMELRSVEDARTAIRDMHVRGAGLIGATAGFGMYLSALEAPERDVTAHFAKAGAALNLLRHAAASAHSRGNMQTTVPCEPGTSRGCTRRER